MSFSAKLQPSQLANMPKSTALAGAGLQDAYWSDDEDEDAECPLCLEEMDIAEMGFKPCPCGYQICMFCYHHIKSNLNGRCPACRREYSEDNVEFTAVAKEDLKRQAQQKKRKERERKELEVLGRRHLANVRVVQRNVVYVVGLGPRFAKEELIPTLRSNEFFGQYGKISKIIISKRHLPGSKSSVVGVYVTYLRREDATKAINALDGSPSPAGDNEVLRASYGTTKYCMSFLRGLNCANNACVDLHEWGDKNDCFTKEDLTTLKHTLKDAENQSRTIIRKKPNEAEASLGTRNASWSQKPTTTSNVQPVSTRPVRQTTARSRNPPSSRPPVTDQLRSVQRSHDRRPPGLTTNNSNVPVTNTKLTITSNQDTQPAAASPRVSSASPPPQPSSPTLPAIARARATEPSPRPPTPVSPNVPDSDVGSSIDRDSQISSTLAHTMHSIPPGLAHPAYQISTPAQELLNDARSRRDVPSASVSPFPEFDRTLENLGSTDFNFKWTMDVNLTSLGNDGVSDTYHGNFDPFSGPPPVGLQPNERMPHIAPPPGLTQSPRQSASTIGGYRGVFNPFADIDDDSSQINESRDGNRQESRFGFARRRLSSSTNESPKFNAFPPPSPPGDFSPHLRQQYGIAWPQGPTPRSAFSSPALYSAAPPGMSYEYGIGPSSLKMKGALSELRSEQQPVFPPGLNFQLYDNMDDRIRPSPQISHVSQMLDYPMSSGSTNKAISQISNPSSVPPGFSPRDIGSEFSESMRSAAILPQSGTLSNHRSSISSTPANASPNLPFAPSWDQSVPIEKPVLLPEDFPALPSSTVPDTNIKKDTQPRFTAKDTKVSVQPAILTRKVPSNSLIKDLKPQTKQSESTSIKSPAIPASPSAPTPPTDTLQPVKPTKARKADKKEDKNELKHELKEDNRSTNAADSVVLKSSGTKDTGKSTKASKVAVPPSAPAPELVQAPMFSKVSKKSKPKESRIPKAPKESKEEAKANFAETSKDESSATTGTTTPKSAVAEVSSTASMQITSIIGDPFSITNLIEQIIRRGFDISSLAFFNPKLLETDSAPLQYDPLVHALSALSVGGGSFANNLPPVSIDSAVSSFQQLLETLTKTISDLLRLLPPATWDDSSSFDSVLRDMLKGDDFLDDASDENGKDDEVAALTLALEKRARWMEVQLAKLEELHRDINMAAVRAILTVSDRGWDPCGFMHRSNTEPVANGDSLARFDSLGMIQGKGKSMRRMTVDGLQKALSNAKQEEKAAKQAVLDSMAKIAAYFPTDYDE